MRDKVQVVRNTGRAQAVIDFIERRLLITIGKTAGQPFILREFQKQFIREVYEPANARSPNTRLVRRAVYSVARKNGKTELAAALILVHLIGPECELNGEIYSAANDREQAGIVFNAVRRMVEANPFLQKYLTVTAATKTIYVHRQDIRARGSRFRALSAEAGTKHGLNPSMLYIDELAQTKNFELLDTLLTSQGARDNPLCLITSTQNNDPTHRLSEMIDDGLKGEDPTIYVQLHVADDECDLMDEAQWFKGNPALDDFRSLDDLRTMAERAKRMPSEEQMFRLLYLNQRVSLNASMITSADWKRVCPAPLPAEEGDTWQFEPEEEIYLGIDMSVRTDLTALVAVSKTSGSRVKSWFFKPQEYAYQHSTRDRKDYPRWEREGWLTLVRGRSVDPRAVAMKIGDLKGRYRIAGIAYDRWRIDELLRCLDAEGIEAQEGPGDGIRLVPWGQGFGDFAPALDAFEHAVVQEELQSDGNPILTWCVLNAQSVCDPAGNRKLDKSATRFRIDGAVALAMALGLKARDLVEGPAINPWEDPAFSFAKLF